MKQERRGLLRRPLYIPGGAVVPAMMSLLSLNDDLAVIARCAEGPPWRPFLVYWWCA